MLAESLVATRDRVVRLYQARAREAGPAGAPVVECSRAVTALLDELDRALRGNRVPFGGDGGGSTFDSAMTARDLQLLSRCIHDVIDELRPDASPWELRVLSDFFCAAAISCAERAREEARAENASLLEQLRANEARFAVALAGSPITVFELDRDLRHLWVCNPPFGLRESDLLGRTIPELVPPEDAARLADFMRPALESGERVHGEVHQLGPGGETVYYLGSMEPLRDASGAIRGVVGACTNITHAKKTQQELAQALAFRERIMGILGHDLRNPLTVVRTLTALLLRREDVTDRARRSLSEIDRAARRMYEMIGTLLDFAESRFKGSLPIRPVPADLREVCHATVDELLTAEPGRTVHLEAPGDTRGMWDPDRLAQVVSNLVGNALKHGDPHAPVSVSITATGDEVVLRVENEGPVIAPELMPVLFEPFRAGADADDASQSRGLGLGLFIVRQIVTAHGGEIEVESTADRGTAFTVTLPRAGAAVRTRDASAPESMPFHDASFAGA